MEQSSRREFLKSVPQFVLKAVRQTAQNGILNLPVVEELNGKTRIAQAGVARIEVSKCLAWMDQPCQMCFLACPLRGQAISIEELKPVITAASCDGCAMCQTACQTVTDDCAIQIL
jgi:Pyruvate/2-oxoacid:ferredoxin oxidoreductase delta subunit